MGIDVVTFGEGTDIELADETANLLRIAATCAVDESLTADVEPTGDPIREFAREHFAQSVGDRVLARQGHHVGRRALQHGDVPGDGCHRGNQGDCGGTTADDDDLLARVVEILRPGLRVDDDTLEVLPTLEVRRVPTGVVVVTRCREQDVAGDVPLLAVALQGHRPLRRVVGEVST